MIRTVALVAVLSFVPTVAFGQAAASATNLDPAFDNPLPDDGDTMISRQGAGHGLSGSLRILLTSPSTVLEPEALVSFGDGWDRGHRWTRLGGGAGPAVLGEPVYRPEDHRLGPVVAPDAPGAWRLESGTGTSLTVIAQVPASRQTGTHLNGYHIGVYPVGADRTDSYAPPHAFIEVTQADRDLQVSKHLTLGQFLTKDQFDVWPKYVALDLRLIDKIELVVQELNAMGVRAEKVHVMSGFRTPQYNGPGGGGRAGLSRHMWGDAADVWIDNNGDGQMDDLNGDGLIDMDDAAVMMRAVERVERKFPGLVGGAGTYPTTPWHGPYIHIDARGYWARW